MTKRWRPAKMDPVRVAGVAFASSEYVIVPTPVPDCPPVIVIQSAVETDFHEQSRGAEIEISPA